MSSSRLRTFSSPMPVGRLPLSGLAAVDDGARHALGGAGNLDVDERAAVVAHSVLEGVLDEDDEEQWRNRDSVGQRAGVVEANLDVVRIADAHQFDVVLEELDVAAERDDLASRVVEHVAHHLRELDDGILGALGVDVNQRVDVVERVHEEVRVNLVLEVVHLGLHVLALELLHLLLVANRLVHELDAPSWRRS